MPRIVNRDEKKFLIMKSAITEFAASGFANSGMSEIAIRTDLGRTAFYSYFKDKQEILKYAVDYLLELTGTDYKNACDNVFLSATEKLDFVMKAFIRDILGEREIISVLLEILLINSPDFAGHKKKVLARMNGIKRLFAKILDYGIKAGEIKLVNTESMSHMLLMMLVSMLYSIHTFSDESVRKTVESCSLLLTGLKTDSVM